MKLNHDIYKEAMENVRISDETGLELLERAAQKKAQRGRKRLPQIAAIAIGILTVSLSINGICFAQTGRNVWEMFAAFYENNHSQEAEALAQEARHSGDSITYRNFKFTLEDYWFDQENATAFFAVRTETLDKTPIQCSFDWETYADSLGLKLYEDSLPTPEALLDTLEGYSIWPSGVFAGSYGSSEPKISEDGTSALQYIYCNDLWDKSGKPLKNLELEIYCSYDAKDTVVENIAGTFQLEPTGQLDSRTIDCSSMKYGTDQCKITSAGVSLYFDGIFGDLINWNPDPLASERDIPFRKLEIEMSDGDIYRCDYLGYRREVIPVYDSEGNILNENEMTEEEAEFAKMSPGGTIPHAYDIPKNLHLTNGNWSNNYWDENKTNEWSIFTASFDNLLDVSKIKAVYIDGKEMPLK